MPVAVGSGPLEAVAVGSSGDAVTTVADSPNAVLLAFMTVAEAGAMCAVLTRIAKLNIRRKNVLERSG